MSNTLYARTNKCIALGSTGNFQGSVVYFDLDRGGVLKQWVAHDHSTVNAWPNHQNLLTWGKKFKQVCYCGIMLAFLNWHKKYFLWDDGASNEDEGLVTLGSCNDFLSEWPGIELKSNYSDKNQPFGVILKMMVLLLAKLLQMLISHMMRLLLRLQECKTWYHPTCQMTMTM